MKMRIICLLTLACLTLTACGGGGGGSRGGGGSTGTQSDFERGIFRADSTYKNLCLAPRPGNFPDSQGSIEDENDWLRAWSHDLYLWYDEIVDVDPALYSTPAYFELMKTNATIPSGAPKDNFHFSLDTAEWELRAQSGISAGYGMEISLVEPAPPREIAIAFVEPSSPAATALLTRGLRIVEVDGTDAVNDATQAGVDALNAALFPSTSGESHQFVLEDAMGATSTVTLTSAAITVDPVPTSTVINTPSGPVGYMHFTTHIAPAEARLVAEVQNLANAGVVDLVLDLRYNGGGFLDIANEMAFMIAGPAAAQGREFGEIRFNDKYPTTNPVTGTLLTPTNFHSVTQGFSLTQGSPLPSLDLARVFILSGPGTCSASEAIINGLRGLNSYTGVSMEVILIGESTCGKPYGFYPTDNCGTTYFTIQFQEINAAGFGDFPNGFQPTPMPVSPDEVLGCVVADDFDNPLGNINEARLATALNYIETGACPPQPLSVGRQTKSITLPRQGPELHKPTVMPGMIQFK